MICKQKYLGFIKKNLIVREQFEYRILIFIMLISKKFCLDLYKFYFDENHTRNTNINENELKNW